MSNTVSPLEVAVAFRVVEIANTIMSLPHAAQTEVHAAATKRVVEAARKAKMSAAKFPEVRIVRILDEERMNWEIANQTKKTEIIVDQPRIAKKLSNVKLKIVKLPNGEKAGHIVPKTGAHANCDHEATKVARAKCRRARAAAAKGPQLEAQA